MLLFAHAQGRLHAAKSCAIAYRLDPEGHESHHLLCLQGRTAGRAEPQRPDATASLNAQQGHRGASPAILPAQQPHSKKPWPTCSAFRARSMSGKRLAYCAGSARDSAALGLILAKSVRHNCTTCRQQSEIGNQAAVPQRHAPNKHSTPFQSGPSAGRVAQRVLSGLACCGN